MHADNDGARRADVAHVEGPSATSSPDNQDSGPFAYVLVAVVLALLVFVPASMGSCVRSVGRAGLAWRDYAGAEPVVDETGRPLGADRPPGLDGGHDLYNS